ncbi:hypothetical protein [Veronia pacifica]|nr:hypothetical protein [Veronia pacifica]
MPKGREKWITVATCLLAGWMSLGCESVDSQGPLTAPVSIGYLAPPKLAITNELTRVGIRSSHLSELDDKRLKEELTDTSVSGGPIFVQATDVPEGKYSAPLPQHYLNLHYYTDSQTHDYQVQQKACNSSTRDSCAGIDSFHVRCEKTSTIAVLDVSITKVKNSEDIFSRSYSERTEFDRCENDSDQSISKSRDAAFLAILSRLKEDMLPHQARLSASLIQFPSTLTEPYNTQFLRAFQLALRGQSVSACHVFIELYNELKQDFSLSYNAAVCFAVVGDLDATDAAYKIAESLANNTDKIHFIKKLSEKRHIIESARTQLNALQQSRTQAP